MGTSTVNTATPTGSSTDRSSAHVPASTDPRSSPSPVSVALLADLIHNFGDALTALPLGIAFYLRSFRGEKLAGLFVVLTIFVSACVALYETIQRFIHPQDLTHLWVLAAAGVIGFAGNELAAQVRLRGGRVSQLRPHRRRQPRPRRRLRLLGVVPSVSSSRSAPRSPTRSSASRSPSSSSRSPGTPGASSPPPTPAKWQSKPRPLSVNNAADSPPPQTAQGNTEGTPGAFWWCRGDGGAVTERNRDSDARGGGPSLPSKGQHGNSWCARRHALPKPLPSCLTRVTQ